MNEQLAQRHLSFVEAVCVRPRMYTATGTLEEVFCFLNGFYSGMIAHTTDQRVIAHADHDWHDFLRFTSGPHATWVKLYQSLRQAHAEDVTAFAELLSAYQKYRLENWC